MLLGIASWGYAAYLGAISKTTASPGGSLQRPTDVPVFIENGADKDAFNVTVSPLRLGFRGEAA